MTLSEKILARHAGLDRVEPGQIINANVDLVLANELSAAVAIAVMRNIKGADKVFDKHKIALVEDHFVPAKDAQSAKIAKFMKDFAIEQEIEHFYDVGRGGIEHVILPEKGLVAPGELMAAAIRWAKLICELSPMSIRASKQAVMMGLDEPSLQAALAGQNAFPAVAAMYRSADFKEGPKAFSEKRAPNWTGA